MALIDCSECGHRVSDKAMTCPECGYPVVDNNDLQQAYVDALSKMSKADSSFDYKCAESRFRVIPGYLDADSLADACRHCAKTIDEASTDQANYRKLHARLSADEALAAVAENEYAPTAVLKILAQDGGRHVRIYVALNKKAPADVLRELSDDGSFSVRAGVARNDKAPVDLIRKLAHDDVLFVRAAAANNEEAPADVLEGLAHDDDSFVRTCVASNKKAPVDVLRKLAEDEDEEVRDVAIVTLDSQA